jgi:Forkhead domain
MSNRERREIARAQKAAEAKEANGGITPPPTGRAKPIRPPVKAEVADLTKPEKRKYTKRKRAETDEVLPSIEGEDADAAAATAAGSDDDARTTRKARPSRSRSPDYPPKKSLTEDQLAKPPDNYARLIYDILVDIHPRELGLRQIYRELKKKFPYFVHVVQTEGWQSSVRHNLNSEHTKLFEKGQKDGKGWAWRAIKGAMEPKEELEKKRKAQAVAAAAKANANSMPNGPRYPPQGPPRPGQQWQPQQTQMFMYPGMSTNGTGHPQPFYAQPMHPHGVPWTQPYPQGPPSGQLQNVPLRSGSGPPPFPLNQPGPLWPYPTNGHAPPGVVQMFERPTHPPPPSQNGQHGAAASSGSPSLERPPSPGTTLARAEDATSPCSVSGMAILGRFIDAIVKDYDSEQDKVRAREVFEDAKKVVLHGAPEPSFTADSDKEMFGVMITFVRGILKDYPNPGYVRRPVQAVERGEGLQNVDGDGKDVEMEGNEKEKNQDQED